MDDSDTPRTAVVVGIDGSRAAIAAALWAVDDAVNRDIPLRLIYAIDPDTANDVDDHAVTLAKAEVTVRYAVTAVQSTERSVKIEVEIAWAKPVAVLSHASRTAAMVCVGAVGVDHFDLGKVCSTTKSLIGSAGCPVAIVHENRFRASGEPGWIVVEADESAESDRVLQFGVDQARLRRAPLRVLVSWQLRSGAVHSAGTADDCDRLVRARLDQRIARWTRVDPGLDIRPVVVHGSPMMYLADRAHHIQLVVIGADNGSGVDEVFTPNGYAALHNTGCSVVIVDRRRAL